MANDLVLTSLIIRQRRLRQDVLMSYIHFCMLSAKTVNHLRPPHSKNSITIRRQKLSSRRTMIVEQSPIEQFRNGPKMHLFAESSV